MGIEHEANNLAGTVQALQDDVSGVDSSDTERGHPLSPTHHADVSGDFYSVLANFKATIFGKEMMVVYTPEGQRSANFHVTPDQLPKV